MGRLSRKQVYEVAEQILTGSKTWKDFQGIDEDDRAKVQALLNRGLAALAESREDVEVPKHTAARLKRKVQETQYVFVPQRKKAHFLSQSGGVGFDPIDINLVCGESLEIRSLVFEALQRRLEAPELTLWISSLALTEWQAFREALSDRAIEEWERRVAALPEDIPLFEREAVWAKASIIITNTLKDASGLQDESLEAIKSYELHLEKQLDSYCRSLPEKMGLLGHLKNFTNVQWTKLAGFTPRSDLACILEFLPQDIRARMLQPLPAQQKQDVAELVRFHEDKRQKELRAFGEAIQALKHWAASIDKVVHLAVEYEE